ncbi:hypothetical protein ACFSL6_18150 [Paenibacillus thailandensis]|uniref:Uncharacterized protein n=1 Tax=Paenibacillus thailandensis TaxID=393250 RepID=A0ABW5QSH2_9BACL
MIFATLANCAQLANAEVLAGSIKRHYPDAYTVLCLIGEIKAYSQSSFFDETVFISVKQNGDEFGPLSPYKAYLVHSLLQSHDEPVIYMDARSRIYAPIDELIDELERKNIVGVPFISEPQDNVEEEIERLRKGTVNAGLLALRPNEHTRKFAAWWLSRVSADYFGPSRHADSEHRWLSLAMDPFGLHLFKHPAYHLSAWNAHEKRRMLRVENDHFFAGGSPLKTACFDEANVRLDRQTDAPGSLAFHQLALRYSEECAAILSGKEPVL